MCYLFFESNNTIYITMYPLPVAHGEKRAASPYLCGLPLIPLHLLLIRTKSTFTAASPG